MRRILLLLTFCLFVGKAFAQERQPFFYQIYADHGITSDKTTRVIEDHQGFVWVGTEEGLNKIVDLIQFEQYKFDRNDSTTLSNDHITALYEDSRKRLWVGTKDGLNLYNRESNKFQRVSTLHTDGHDHGIRINDIIEDENNDLWVICRDHLVKIGGENLDEQEVIFIEEGQPNLIRLALFESRLRLGTSAGVYTLVEGTLQKSGMADDLPVTDLLATRNELWIGTASKGVIRYNAISGTTKTYRYDKGKGKLGSNHVNDLALIDGKELWVGTIHGVSALDLENDTSRHFYYDFDNAFSLSDRVVLHIYQDRAGNVWLTSPNSGVNYYHKADNLFNYYGQSEEEGTSKDLMDYGILSIYTEGEKTWLGSRKGISYLNKGVFQHYPLSPGQAMWATGVFAIERDQSGQFWLGTDQQLMNWNPVTGNYSFYDTENFRGNKVNALAISDQQELWIGTEEHGLKVIDLANQSAAIVTSIPDPVTNSWPSIQSVLPTPDGVLVGTKAGLYAIIGKEIRKVPLSVFNDGLSDDLVINALSFDQKGNVLVGTKHDGLVILNPEFEPLNQIGTKQGMASQDVRGIIEGENKNLWVSTNAGLSRLIRKGDGVAEVKNYDIADGLQSNHFAVRSAGQLANGKILMGGLSGLTIFHPNDVLDFKTSQNLNFISLAVNDEKVKIGEEGSPLTSSISTISKIVLSPKQNHFTIEFNALDYTRPSGIEYRYKMKGVNNEWIDLKATNKVTFQNLTGGRSYTFMVQSKGRFSDWSATKELNVFVQPYFYETLWFQILAIVVIGLLLGVLLWIRAGRSARKEKELEEMIVERSAELQEEVAVRRETENKLKAALVEAERASEVKSQFLANMSHEIRTPLNGIMGMTELSLETDLDSEQYTMLDTIYKSTQSLKSIVNDILDIAKIEAGVLKIVNEKYSVHDALDQVMASFQLQANQKNLSLKHWVLPKVPPKVLGDAGRLRQVLVNLVANAMKFTHSGSITVIVDAMNQRSTSLELWFTITDSGIGIPEYQQEHIFKSFMQVESGPSRAYGGTGLGLSISKELVEKMGGEIWVESEEGKGSIFSFYIRVEEAITEEGQSKSIDEKTEALETFSGKVLIVEDIRTNQLVTAKMCEKMGLEPTCVRTGREGLALLKEEHFDLVLMDLQMPEIDGLGITRLIKSSVIVNQNVPIVAVTASASEEIQERCMAAGMNGFLAKPVSMKELHDTLQPLLSEKQGDTV